MGNSCCCGCCAEENVRTVHAKSKLYVAHASSQQPPSFNNRNQKKQELRRLTDENEKLKISIDAEKEKYETWATQTNINHQRELKQAGEKLRQAEQKQTYEAKAKDRYQQDLTQVRERLKQTEQRRSDAEQAKARLSEERSILQKENHQLKEEKNSLLSRLSAIAGAKLTDGNANIADLSDESRPTKIAEKYSELYDNEWTEAFSILTEDSKMSEENACRILAKALCMAYDICQKKASGDLENAAKAMKAFNETPSFKYEEVPTEMSKQLKDQRKKLYKRHAQTLFEMHKKDLRNLFPKEEKIKCVAVDLFLQKCVEMCWMMAIQDPQVYVDTELQHFGDPFETERYKHYTKSGPYIDFIVWPTLYLLKGGSILTKGVAQGTTEKRTPDYDNIAPNTNRKPEPRSDKDNEKTTVTENASFEKNVEKSTKQILCQDQKEDMTGTKQKDRGLQEASRSMLTSQEHKKILHGDSQTKAINTGSQRSTSSVTTVYVNK